MLKYELKFSLFEQAFGMLWKSRVDSDSIIFPTAVGIRLHNW